ncbi:flagellar export protein FliJ [candidate division GN15 bacterium]|uniref:Flagellar FliJ protein n=1 Tax=candidate division GN15 bacterium TaxID=2072418 RepID=A0A855X2V3_9BACT|nr:MAG: flagellar export protein FliJ [candidate division GN15 bacterium]
MKKFRYRLEPILKIRSHVEKQRQKDHATALQQVYRQKEQLAAIDQERARTFAFQRAKLEGRIHTQQLLSASRYLVRLKRDTMTGSELLKGLEREAERKRQLLVQASRERKIYEKLRERQETKFNQEVEQHDRKTLDELAVVTFVHRHRR